MSKDFIILDSSMTLAGLSKEQKEAVKTLLKLQDEESRQEVHDKLHTWATKTYEWFQRNNSLSKHSIAYKELCEILGKAP